MLVNNQEIDFVIHKHSVGSDTEYQLSFGSEELQFLNFKDLGQAVISNEPNVTRLLGRESEDTRTPAWLTFDGRTANAEKEEVEDGRTISLPGVYEIFDSGKAMIGQQTDEHTEIFLKGSKLSDRWILRKIPNIFTKVFQGEEPIYVFWKPPVQKSFNSQDDYVEVDCPCSVKNASAKFHDLVKEEGETKMSEMITDVVFDNETHTFRGIAAAEGTWIDMYGNKYTYTPEFITHNYNEQLARLKSGDIIPMNTDHESIHGFEGKITDIKLHTDPMHYIEVSGTYSGPSDIESVKMGLSYEYRLKAVWNAEFQSWVPFSAITDKLSVVEKPACKICWINSVS